MCLVLGRPGYRESIGEVLADLYHTLVGFEWPLTRTRRRCTDVGPTAWVGLAALAYKVKNPDDTAFDDMIIGIARYISTNQWKLQWGGDGAVNFASNRLQSVASTEHNLDLYALLKGIRANSALYARANATLAGDYSIDSTLGNIYIFLTNSVWNAAELHFNGGRNDGKFPPTC